MNNRPRNKAKANLITTVGTVDRLEATNDAALEKLKLIGINLPKELLENPKVASLLGDNNEC
jgi:hypothetical protein